MVQLKGNHTWAGGPVLPKTEGTEGLDQKFAAFAELISDPAALAEPIGGGRAQGGVRTRGVFPTDEEQGRRVPPRTGPPGPRKRSGGRSGSTVGGQGAVSPGGVYTPDPGI